MPSSPPADGALAPPLRGRGAAIAAVEALLAGLREDGRGEVLVVEGAPGSGRTRILAEALTRARGAGVATLTALEVDAGDPLRRLQEAERTLVAAARERPLLVVLDDVERADAATLHALGDLPPRVREHAVGWIVAVRTEARGVVARLDAGGARTLALDPLDDAAAHALAEDVLGARPDDALRGDLTAAGGLPLLLLALLEGWREEGRITVADGIATRDGDAPPARFAAIVEGRLAALPPEARRLVLWVSLITESFSFDLLAALLRTSPAALLGPLREALAAGLVVEVGAELGAPDPLNRAVLAARADAVTRAAARDAALAHVEPEVAVPPAVAAVLAATAEPGDAAALAVLRRAVAERPSAEPAVRALELTPDHDAELLDTAAELLARADRSDDARALVQAALERGLAAPDEARARLALARLAGVEDVAEAAAQSARAAALPDLPPAVVAQVLAERALGLALIGDGPQAATVATAAVAAARAIPDPAAEATALLAASMAAFARHATDEALALGEDALRAVRRDGALPVALWVPGSCWRCLLRSASGQSAEALAEADAGLRVADDHHHAPARRLWSATRACLLPDADRLREDATTGDAPAPPTGWDALTAAELRVVEEVARGGTNRDVAEALGLSANTVGTHLRHAFAKLGVGSRVELARLAAARDRERGDS